MVQATRELQAENYLFTCCSRATTKSSRELQGRMTAVAALSPLYHASPHSFLAEQNNQRVPGSPGLSPFFGRLPRARGVLSSPNSNSPVAHVPEAGSPLLRQILRGSYLDCSKLTCIPTKLVTTYYLSMTAISLCQLDENANEKVLLLPPAPLLLSGLEAPPEFQTVS